LGLLKLLLGFDKSDYKRLLSKIEELKEENKNLKSRVKSLEEHVSRLEGEILSARRAVSSVIEEVEYIKQQLEEQLPEEEDEEPVEDDIANQEELEDQVLSLIMQGITSPTDLLEKTGLSKHKLYDILKRLTEKGIVEKKREGRRVHYKPVAPPPTPPA
jgi:sugar-specific transcriptional regulator TrmB